MAAHLLSIPGARLSLKHSEGLGLCREHFLLSQYLKIPGVTQP